MKDILKKVRILLVEDEAEVMQINRSYLENLNYEVLCAGTLRDAQAAIWEYPPDLILLDVMLPDGSGYDFCRSIRKYFTVPVIFLTCLGNDSNIVTGLEQGGDDYMIKPYSLKVLHARIVAQLRRCGYSVGEIALPPLYINLSMRTVKLDREDISLTHKEFQLLVYLVENRGKELTQAQIYQAVWSGPPETMGNTVRVHISRLRKKLHMNEASCFELSPTVNQGYLFLRTVYRS